MKTCKNCGCVNDTINKYCRNCGSCFDEEKKPTPTFEVPIDTVSLTDNADISAEPETEETVLTPDSPIIDEPEITAQPKPFVDFDFRDEENESCETRVSETVTETQEKRYSTHPVINALKKRGASGVFIAYCILLTAFAVLNSISMIRDLNSDAMYFRELLFKSGYYSASQSAVTGGLAVFNIIVMIPTFLSVLGSWIFYASSRNRRRNFAGTGGLSVIMASLIYRIVLFSVLALIIIIIVFGFGVSIGAIYGGLVATVVLIILGVAAVCYFTLAVVYFARGIKTVSVIKQTSATGVPDRRISVFVIVMNYITAASLSPNAGIFLASGEIISAVGVLCGMAALILLSAVMISYRSEMKALENRQK